MRPVFIYRYVISSTRVYLWVNFQMSGNSPILFQSQRKVQLKRYQTIDQYLCCPWSPKSSNVASTTNSRVSHISTQLHHLQFGFLRGKPTTSQLLHVLQDIHQALESRNQVDAVYLDFEKAFDKVSHKLLLTKLHKFGIRGHLLSWFENYLSGRYQRVTVLGETSDTLPVLSGVPQGSILGSLLFLVYVNDLPHSISGESTVAIFADDTKCYRPVKALPEIWDKMATDMPILIKYGDQILL